MRGGGFKKINFDPASGLDCLKPLSSWVANVSKNIILLSEKEGTSGAGGS